MALRGFWEPSKTSLGGPLGSLWGPLGDPWGPFEGPWGASGELWDSLGGQLELTKRKRATQDAPRAPRPFPDKAQTFEKPTKT